MAKKKAVKGTRCYVIIGVEEKVEEEWVQLMSEDITNLFKGYGLTAWVDDIRDVRSKQNKR